MILRGFLPNFCCALLINWNLHIVKESNETSEAQVEKLVVHLIKVGGFVNVLARVVIEYFCKSEFYLFRVILVLLFITSSRYLSRFRSCIGRQEEENTTAVRDGKLTYYFFGVNRYLNLLVNYPIQD